MDNLIRKAAVATENSSELDDIWDEVKTQIDSGHLDKAIEIYKYGIVKCFV